MFANWVCLPLSLFVLVFITMTGACIFPTLYLLNYKLNLFKYIQIFTNNITFQTWHWILILVMAIMSSKLLQLVHVEGKLVVKIGYVRHLVHFCCCLIPYILSKFFQVHFSFFLAVYHSFRGYAHIIRFNQRVRWQRHIYDLSLDLIRHVSLFCQTPF